MDIKLYNGDFVRCPGGFLSVSGNDEILQRALIRLSVMRGKFLPDLSFGSRLYTLRSSDRSQLTAKARIFANEALMPMGLEVSSVDVRLLENGIRLDYFLKGFDEKLSLEI